MSLTGALAIGGLLLAAALGVSVKLLLDAHEKMGDLKVQIKERDAIIAQKESDAKLSDALVALQTAVETKIRASTNATRQEITGATSDDAAAVAARAGVMRLRAQAGSGSSPSP